MEPTDSAALPSKKKGSPAAAALPTSLSPKKRKHHKESPAIDIPSGAAPSTEEEKSVEPAAVALVEPLSPSTSPKLTIIPDIQSREAARAAKRIKMIRELMTSEDTHVESLKTVVVEYLQPLRAKISKDQIKKLFGNIEVIMGWNMQFINRLKLRQEESEAGEDDGMYFGDVLAEMMVIMRQLYAQYNENYEEAQQTYKELLKNKDFEQFIQNKSIKNQKANLLNALYLPIGRMIVYDSLLREIIQLTPKDHPDYEDLCSALKLVIAATKQADRVVEKRRNMEQVLRIQSQLNGDDIAEPHRRYVYEGDVLLVVGKQTKERSLFLFNDIIILAKLKKKKYDVDAKMALKGVKVVDIEAEHRLFKIVDSDSTEYTFHSEDKQTWLELLNSTIKKLSMTPQELKSLKDEEESTISDESVFGSSTSMPAKDAAEYDRNALAEMIIRWSGMNSDDVLSEVKKVAAKLQQQSLD